jgi:hypothetical protein
MFQEMKQIIVSIIKTLTSLLAPGEQRRFEE